MKTLLSTNNVDHCGVLYNCILFRVIGVSHFGVPHDDTFLISCYHPLCSGAILSSLCTSVASLLAAPHLPRSWRLHFLLNILLFEDDVVPTVPRGGNLLHLLLLQWRRSLLSHCRPFLSGLSWLISLSKLSVQHRLPDRPDVYKRQFLRLWHHEPKSIRESKY